MSESTDRGRRHRLELPSPRVARAEPEVHVALRRIQQAARLAEDMRQTGGKHRRDGT